MMSYSAGHDHGSDNQPRPIGNTESIRNQMTTVEFGGRATVAKPRIRLKIIFDQELLG